MNSQLLLRSAAYGSTLHRHLQRPRETSLQEAYELGRQAIGQGLGVLDMARIHQQALTLCFSPSVHTAEEERALKAVETFFLEALSPFEAAHRGFRQANLRLRQLNVALAGRNTQLAAMNRRLGNEVNERKRTEKALRKSESHYRQLFQQARQMQQSLQRLSRQLLHAQEEERKRISRELHDEVGQALTALGTSLALLQGNGAADPERFKERLADTQALLVQAMETAHHFARELRPAMLDELGLVPALRSYLKGFAERTGLDVTFHPAASAERLENEQKTVVFRVTQESLNNVAKHAHASRVTLTLREWKDGVRMQVKDNGRAFAVGRQFAANGGKRLGLLGMQERVRLANGRFRINSARGKGTTVSVEIPFRKTQLAVTSNPG